MPSQLAHSILAPQTLVVPSFWPLSCRRLRLAVWPLLTLQPTLHSGHKTSGRRSVRGGGHTLSPPSPCKWTYVQPCIYVWQNPLSELSLSRGGQGLENPLQLTDESLREAVCLAQVPGRAGSSGQAPLPSPGACQLSLREGGLAARGK